MLLKPLEALAQVEETVVREKVSYEKTSKLVKQQIKTRSKEKRRRGRGDGRARKVEFERTE